MGRAEPIGLVDEYRRRRLAIMGANSQAVVNRILGKPPIYLVCPEKEVAPIVKAPQIARPRVNISPELQAAIADYAFKVVDDLLAQRRREVLLSSAPLVPNERPTAREVVHIVALHSDRSVDEFLSPRRSRDIAWPRQISMLLVKQALPHLSLPQIGMVFGGRDHTTVMHAVKRGHWHIEQDDAMAQLYRRCRATIEIKWPEAFK